MSETARIADQLERAFRGDAWHGPSLSAALDGVSAAEAAAHPLPGAHSIWELVLHVNAWREVARRALAGDVADLLVPEDDWPAPPASPGAEAWQAARGALEATHERLLRRLEGFPEERLNERAPRKPYSFYVLLHGVIQHDLYHCGQIVLLKKALGGAATTDFRDQAPAAAEECWIPDPPGTPPRARRDDHWIPDADEEE